LKVTRGETVARQTKLEIEVEPDRVERHMDQAYRRLVTRTKVPGFRNGKAPRQVFERYVGTEYLLDQALESLVSDAVAEALKSESLEAAATPRVKVLDRQPVVKLEASIALTPQVTLGDYRSMRVAAPASVVTDEDVEKALERIRDGNATWAPVERDLKLGDLATITATGAVEDKQVLNAQGTEFAALEGGQYPVPGFSEAIAGMKAGETREFALTFPADYSRTDLAGKQGAFKVTLNSLKEKVLPALDDGLAKTVGEGLSTLAELRNRIRESLEAQGKEEARSSYERQVLDALVAGSTFEVPPMMVDHEADHIIYDQHQALAQYKVSLDNYIQSIGKTAEDYVKDAKTTAEERLKRSLVIEKLAEAEAVTVSDDAINSEIERLKALPDIDARTDWDEARESVRRVLRRRAALDRAMEIARQSGLEAASMAGAAPASG
jgi:trigger factor